MPITWKNVGAPEFANKSFDLESTARMFGKATEGANQLIADTEQRGIDQWQGQRDRATDAAAVGILGADTIEEYDALKARYSQPGAFTGQNIDGRALMGLLNKQNDAIRTDITEQDTFNAEQVKLDEADSVGRISEAYNRGDIKGARALMSSLGSDLTSNTRSGLEKSISDKVEELETENQDDTRWRNEKGTLDDANTKRLHLKAGQGYIQEIMGNAFSIDEGFDALHEKTKSMPTETQKLIKDQYRAQFGEVTGLTDLDTKQHEEAVAAVQKVVVPEGAVAGADGTMNLIEMNESADKDLQDAEDVIAGKPEGYNPEVIAQGKTLADLTEEEATSLDLDDDDWLWGLTGDIGREEMPAQVKGIADALVAKYAEFDPSRNYTSISQLPAKLVTDTIKLMRLKDISGGTGKRDSDERSVVVAEVLKDYLLMRKEATDYINLRDAAQQTKDELATYASKLKEDDLAGRQLKNLYRAAN